MKKTLFAFVLTLALSSFCFGQAVNPFVAKINTFKDKKRYSVVYDKFKDETRVGFDFYYLKAKLPLYLKVSFTYKGQELKETIEDVLLVFESQSSDWIFINSNDLTFLADNERIAIGKAYRTGQVGNGYVIGRGVSVTERLIYSVTPEQLDKIANAKDSEFQISNFNYKFEPEHLQMFKNILSLAKK